MADDRDKGLIPLADAIQELRSELFTAFQEGQDQRLKFEVSSIELELNVVVTREGSGSAKASFKLLGIGVEANAGGKLSDAVTQKIKLSLTPKIDGKNAEVNATVDRG